MFAATVLTTSAALVAAAGPILFSINNNVETIRLKDFSVLHGVASTPTRCAPPVFLLVFLFPLFQWSTAYVFTVLASAHVDPKLGPLPMDLQKTPGRERH